ncbi:hypothetical protein N9997_01525 [Synechococcus sp. AH-603-L18]|nr:hypothetical protein [Synechococcus sp. AH-603-L18]MDB4338003.1 hypothetical protein [Synechococcus sp. AH-603-L18]
MTEEISSTITFDDVKYDASELSDDAKYIVHCLQQCEREIQENKMRAGLLMEAYHSFTEKLKAALPVKTEEPSEPAAGTLPV